MMIDAEHNHGHVVHSHERIGTDTKRRAEQAGQAIQLITYYKRNEINNVNI